MAMDPVCEGAKALGHSLPSWHWWLSLSAADQGAWVSGLGAFAAAAAAVGVAWWQVFAGRRERLATEARRAKLMAVDFVEVITRLKADINAARRMLPETEIMLRTGRIDPLVINFLHLDAADRLPRGMALESLPANLGIAIAELAAMAAAYNSIVDSTKGVEGDISEGMVEHLRETFRLDAFLDTLQETLAQTAESLGDYAPHILKVDFRHRGDA